MLKRKEKFAHLKWGDECKPVLEPRPTPLSFWAALLTIVGTWVAVLLLVKFW